MKTLLLTILLLPLTALAQNDSIPASIIEIEEQQNILLNMTAADYANIQLPPLHQLLENARHKSPQVRVYEVEKEVEERELKSIRRTWLKHIKLNASYSYGSNDVTSQQYYNDQYPIIRNVTGSEQIWWNVGANIALPLDEIFDRRNRIKAQRKKIESIQYEADRWHDDICIKIIEAYTSALQFMALLRSASSAMITAQAQYEFSKTDFINGKITAQALSYQKNIETVSIRGYEETLAGLNKALLMLEVFSKTPIITPAEQLDAR